MRSRDREERRGEKREGKLYSGCKINELMMMIMMMTMMMNLSWTHTFFLNNSSPQTMTMLMQ